MMFVSLPIWICFPELSGILMAVMISGSFIRPEHEAVNGPHVYWQEALELPGADQMKFVSRLMESHQPISDRVPDQSLILENEPPASERIQATRGKDYMFIYSAAGKPFTVVLGKIRGNRLNVYWINPRNGSA